MMPMSHLKMLSSISATRNPGIGCRVRSFSCRASVCAAAVVIRVSKVGRGRFVVWRGGEGEGRVSVTRGVCGDGGEEGEGGEERQRQTQSNEPPLPQISTEKSRGLN